MSNQQRPNSHPLKTDSIALVSSLCLRLSVSHHKTVSSMFLTLPHLTCKKLITQCIYFSFNSSIQHLLTFSIQVQLFLHPPSIFLPLQRKKTPLPPLYWNHPPVPPSSCDKRLFPIGALSGDQLEKEHAVHLLSSLFFWVFLSLTDPYFL